MKKFKVALALFMAFCVVFAFSSCSCGSNEPVESESGEEETDETEETPETDEYGFDEDDPEGEVIMEEISISGAKGNAYDKEETAFILNLMDGIAYEDILYTDISGNKMIITYHNNRRLGVCVYDVETGTRTSKYFGKVIAPVGANMESFVINQFYFIGDENYGLFTENTMKFYDKDLKYLSTIPMSCTKPYVNPDGVIAFINGQELHVVSMGKDEETYNLKENRKYVITNFSNEALVGYTKDSEKQVSMFAFDLEKKEVTYSGVLEGKFGKDAYIRPNGDTGADVFDVLKKENAGFRYDLQSPGYEEVVINNEKIFVTAVYEGDEFSEERQVTLFQYNKGQKALACKTKLVDNVDVFSVNDAIYMDDCLIFPTTRGLNPTFILWELTKAESEACENAKVDNAGKTGIERFGVN